MAKKSAHKTSAGRNRLIRRDRVRRGIKPAMVRKAVRKMARKSASQFSKKSSSFLTGIRVPVKKTTRKVAIATEGYYVNGHHLTIGTKKSVSALVKFNNPLNTFMYAGSTKTQSTNSGMQQVQILELNKNNSMKDIFRNFSNLNFDNNQDNANPTAGYGNDNNENMAGTGVTNPEASRIIGALNKLYLEQSKILIRVVNDCELGCKMEILPMIARRDILTYNQQVANGLNSPTAGPLTYFKQLVLQQQGYSASGFIPAQVPFIDINNPGLRPYDRRFVKDFEKFYKILTPAKFMLQAGQNTQYHFTHNIYREISGIDVLDYQATEGIALYFMIFVEGSLVGSTKSSDSLKTSIGTSSIRIVYEQTNYVRACAFNRGHTFQMGRLDRGFTTLEQTFMDPINGEKEVNPEVADID